MTRERRPRDQSNNNTPTHQPYLRAAAAILTLLLLLIKIRSATADIPTLADEHKFTGTYKGASEGLHALCTYFSQDDLLATIAALRDQVAHYGASLNEGTLSSITSHYPAAIEFGRQLIVHCQEAVNATTCSIVNYGMFGLPERAGDMIAGALQFANEMRGCGT